MLLTDKEFIGFENVKITAGPATNTKYICHQYITPAPQRYFLYLKRF